MSSIFDIAGNNIPEITQTASSNQTLKYVRCLIDRKRNSFPGYFGDNQAGADGYNRAIVELDEELDLIIRKLDASSLANN